MSIRHGLLALLERGQMYGYQLRAAFEESTGSTSLLENLARLVELQPVQQLLATRLQQSHHARGGRLGARGVVPQSGPATEDGLGPPADLGVSSGPQDVVARAPGSQGEVVADAVGVDSVAGGRVGESSEGRETDQGVVAGGDPVEVRGHLRCTRLVGDAGPRDRIPHRPHRPVQARCRHLAGEPNKSLGRIQQDSGGDVLEEVKAAAVGHLQAFAQDQHD
ncbi:hypothetical protein AB0N23_31265, partial [Streptomyces sp. NPDC052644]